MDKKITISSIINDIRNEIARGNLMPERAAELLVKLSSLLGNCLDEITKTDMLYNQVLLDYFNTEKTANRAKIKAGTTKEYKEMKDARNMEKITIEMIRGLKYFLRAKTDEFHTTKFQ